MKRPCFGTTDTTDMVAASRIAHEATDCLGRCRTGLVLAIKACIYVSFREVYAGDVGL